MLTSVNAAPASTARYLQRTVPAGTPGIKRRWKSTGQMADLDRPD